MAGCAAEPHEPETRPIAAAPPSVTAANSAQDEWNLFPDPLTGRVEVYHRGTYVGAVTGNESEDPPIPHKLRRH